MSSPGYYFLPSPLLLAADLPKISFSDPQPPPREFTVRTSLFTLTHDHDVGHRFGRWSLACRSEHCYVTRTSTSASRLAGSACQSESRPPSSCYLDLGRCCRMSLQSALIGFLLSRALASSITPQENVVVQTTAVATGTMALAAGFVGIIPALGLLNIAQDGTEPIHLSWTAALAWSFAVAYYGSVLLTRSPLRFHF